MRRWRPMSVPGLTQQVAVFSTGSYTGRLFSGGISTPSRPGMVIWLTRFFRASNGGILRKP